MGDGTSGGLAANYTLTGGTHLGTITQAALTLTAGTETKVYDGTTDSSASVVVDGLQDGDTLTSLTQSYQSKDVLGTDNSLIEIEAGYVINDGNSGGNYAVTENAAAATITPAPLSVTASDASKTYGDLHTFASSAFTSSGLQNSETIGSVTLTSSGTGTTANAGTYNITPSLATGGTFDINNYSVTYANGSLTVDPAALTITASDASKTYGVTHSFVGTEFTSDGLKNSDEIDSVTLTSDGTAATADVTIYDIVPSAATGTSFTAGNYSITYVNGTLTVNPAALTITASDASKTYGDLHTFAGTEFTSVGLQNSDAIDTVSLTSLGTDSAANVGTYDIAANDATGSAFNANNYTITYNNGMLTVQPASLTLSAHNLSKEYGEVYSFAGNEYDATGLKNSETVGSVDLFTLGSPVDAVVGDYDILISNATSGTFNPDNYLISYNHGVLIVTDNVVAQQREQMTEVMQEVGQMEALPVQDLVLMDLFEESAEWMSLEESFTELMQEEEGEGGMCIESGGQSACAPEY